MDSTGRDIELHGNRLGPFTEVMLSDAKLLDHILEASFRNIKARISWERILNELFLWLLLQPTNQCFRGRPFVAHSFSESMSQ